MLFNDPVFIFLFLPVVVTGYFFLGRYTQSCAPSVWLLSASLFFYAQWNAYYLLLLAASVAINFSIGQQLRNKTQQRHRYRLLWLGIASNLSLLAYYKYADFFISNVNNISNTNWPLLELLLPLAISFFSFQQIAYLVDCYRHQVQEHSFLNYAMFVCFFPQLIAGPIVHHRLMMPQFAAPENKHLQLEHLRRGMFLFAVGLFKKLILADNFATIADAGFADTANLDALNAWLTSLSYTFQIYFDFSGYCDMAIGAALMLNIYLPINFNSPYKARNIQEFWRRWHITLSNWLRDYVYIPFGGNRGSSNNTYRNLLLTFVLGGLWHGAAWTFVIWGAMHGAALAAHRLFQQSSLQIPRWLAIMMTFIFVNFAWVMFRADSLNDAFVVYQAMFGFTDITSPATLGEPSTYQLMGFAAILLSCLLLPNSMALANGSIKKPGPVLSSALLCGVMFFIALIANNTSTPSPFLYFNF